MSNDDFHDPLESELRELRPAATKLDSQSVFYQAGYRAGLSSVPKSSLRSFVPAIAASLLVTLVAVPASYQAGQQAANTAASPSDRPAEQDDATGSFEPRLDRASSAAILADITDKHEARNLDSPDMKERESSRTKISKPAASELFAESKSQLLARWLSPIKGMAESAKLDRQAQSTLTAGHSSLIAREDSAWNWVNFPFAVTSDGQTQTSDTTAADAQSPLAATDLKDIAITLEALR